MRSSGDEARKVAVPEWSGGADRERAEELVLRLVGSQADSLLRVARRYSLCADDAHDAYQRGLEILMRHAARLDPERAAGWLHTVVKHEALAINRSRRRLLGSGDIDLDALEARTSASPEDRLLSSDRVARSAEALHGLKPQEVRALWLKALGHSYEQICEATGWTYTKVNRCLAEGRKSFLERYAGIESGRECERLAPALSALVDGEVGGAQAVELRNHLRQCLACRAAVRGLHDASRPLTVVLPAAGIAAGGATEQTSSLFVRVYETLTMHLNERAANSLLRAQAIVDTVTASKLAAAAASAAAVAGGGVAVEGALTAPGHQPAAVMRRVEGAASLAFVKQASQPRSGAKARTSRSQDRRAKPDRGRAPAKRDRGRALDKQAASSPATPRPRPSPPPATTTSTTVAAPRASAAAAGAEPAGSAAAGEFGFEGP
jgi:RNA polymerase sigma factor (sigma-70 family)